jgi:small ligand-binding sensory domain FIST
MTEFYAGVSTETDPLAGVARLSSEIIENLGDTPDLVVTFLSPHHRKSASQISAEMMQALTPKVLLGCTGEGVIGPSLELERQPAISVWAARLPGVTLVPFHLRFEEGPDGIRLIGWPKDPPRAEDHPFFIMLAEPFSTPAGELLVFLQQKYPSVPVLGGMASGARVPGENQLLFNGEVREEGVVGIAAYGGIRLESVVSQGCRPIGDRFLVTRAERNVIHELGGRPALHCLTEVFEELTEEEKEMARNGLHLGCAIDEQKEHFDRGDFLVRNLIGIDEETGSLAIGDLVDEGQTVQFHIRDAESAKEDLRLLLESRKREMGEHHPEAALLFSCNGRGRRFFGAPHADVGAIRERLGNIPVAGFFAQGEIGPIGRKNFLHGFTASVALFCRSK